MRKWTYIAGFALLAYALSFGPLLYGASLWARRDPGGTGRYIARGFLRAYYPHLVVMRWSYPYFRYGAWWSGLAYGGIAVTEDEWRAYRGRRLDL